MESIISGAGFEREEVSLQDNEPGKAGSGHPLEDDHSVQDKHHTENFDDGRTDTLDNRMHSAGFGMELPCTV